MDIIDARRLLASIPTETCTCFRTFACESSRLQGLRAGCSLHATLADLHVSILAWRRTKGLSAKLVSCHDSQVHPSGLTTMMSLF